MSSDTPAPITVPVPAHLCVFVEVLGVDTAIEFLLEFGGAPLYIGKGGGRSHLESFIGTEKTRALYARRDVIPARIPNGKVWIAQVWSARGQSVASIARKLRVSDVTVRNYKQKLPALSALKRSTPHASDMPVQLDFFRRN